MATLFITTESRSRGTYGLFTNAKTCPISIYKVPFLCIHKKIPLQKKLR